MIPASYYAPQQETDSKASEQRAQMDERAGGRMHNA